VLNPDGTSAVLPGGFTYLPKVMTGAIVTSANSPYTALPTDDLIVIDESNGLLATVLFEPNPTSDAGHTVVWFKWAAGAPPPVVNGNGKQLVPYSQTTQQSGALVSSTQITSQGDRFTWKFDGVEWVSG